MPHYIITKDTKRAERWQKLFGTDALPIIGDSARWQEIEAERPAVFAFDLDTTQLPPDGFKNFIEYVAEKRKLGKIARQALPSQLYAYPINARGCEVVSEAEMFARQHSAPSVSHSTQVEAVTGD